MGKYEKMGDFFDRVSDTYDTHMEENIESFTEFYSIVGNSIPETQDEIVILDIGCGTGLELAAVFGKAPNALVTGIDMSCKMLDLLRKKYAKYHRQITLVQGSYETYSFGEKTYDCIISVMTLHHLLPESKRDLYRKIRKALKSGGKYIEGDYIATPEKEKEARDSFYEIRKLEHGLVDGTHHIDIPCSVETQKELLAKAGFRSVEVLYEAGEAAIFNASV